MKIYTILAFVFCTLVSPSVIFAQQTEERPEFTSLADPNLAPFYHGVASGDPLSDRVIIWTRVTPENGETSFDVDYVVALDKELTNTVKIGRVQTNAERDFTVKIDVDGLAPNTTYYYGFSVNGLNSLTGRTKTAPTSSADFLRFAVVSCSNYTAGFFSAYREISERKDLDAVIHLGDYLYENGGANGDRVTFPRREILVLDDYRTRYSLYRLDPDCRAAHQQHPFIAVWDDHESTNNSWKDGASNHTEGAEGIWSERKQQSQQAYYEWMPIRLPDEENDFGRIWRTINYGELADLIMIDTRLYGRDEQTATATIADSELNDPDRTILGPEQLQWFLDRLENSTAKWKIVGNQVMFMPFNIAGLPLVDQLPGISDFFNTVFKDGGTALNADAWDGYPKERLKILDHLRDKNIDNVVILTGDIHTTWAADLPRDPYNPLSYIPFLGIGSLAVEFVTPSVTSSNIDAIDATGTTGLVLHPAIRLANPHMKEVDLFSHGYMILDLDANKAQSDWYYIDDVMDPNAEESYALSFKTDDGQNRLQTADEINRGDQGPDLAPNFPPGRPVGINSVKNVALFGVYPNPADDYIMMQLSVAHAARVDIQIADLQGKVWGTYSINPTKEGFYRESLPLSDLPSGMYVLQLTSGTEKNSFSFIKR